MARRSQGFALKQHQKGIWYVRFTHQARRYDLSTGTRDQAQARTAAQRIYADIITGRRTAQVVIAPGAPIDILEVGGRWLDAISSSLDPLTVEQYLMYIRAHLAPFFGSLSAVTTTSAEAYANKRLGEVQRESLLKELSALRGMLQWCAGEHYLTAVPDIQSPQPKATGTVVFDRRVTELSPQQVKRFLSVIPKRTRHAAREYFTFMYETGLRPATIHELRTPDNYRRGAKTLLITGPIDKARFGRELPLTRRARQALDAVCPIGPGLIFGHHDYRAQLENACRMAKLPAFTPYDLRHARGTHLIETSGNLPGVAYLFGHRNTATTSARYVHPSLRAAKDVLGKSK